MKREANQGRMMCMIVGLALAASGVAPIGAQEQDRDGLREQIELYRAASLHADPPQMTAVQAGRIWTRLGMLYEDAGTYAQSEMAFVHALRLLETPPVSESDRARAMDELGTLYTMRGDSKQAEAAEQHALAIREAQSLTKDLPRSWFHLATLELREHHAERARQYAQEAVTQLRTDPDANRDDRINALFVLAMSLCRLHRFPEAIATSQEAMAVVRSTYGPDDFPTGFGSFLLGYAYWKSGDAAKAMQPMQTGASQVVRYLGWEHPACLSVMTQYEQFLRSTHRDKEAHTLREALKKARNAPGFARQPETLTVLSLF